MRNNKSRWQRAMGQGWICIRYESSLDLDSSIIEFLSSFHFAGFSEKIPGYPRYTMIGDRSYGIFNLRIQNASLEDDAEFQCQVGPAKNSDPIRTAANLTVICEYRFRVPRACALLSIITPRIIKLSKHDIVLAQGCVECQHNPLSISQVDVYSHAGHLKNNSFVTKANNTLCNLCVRCVLAAAADAVT